MAAHQLPSPSSSASLSPRQGSHSMARHSSCNSEEDHDHDGARSALEIRREKNRIKQRNLRQRRANQMSDLETNVASLTSKNNELEDRLAMIEAREASLVAWARELETAMVAHGHRDQVDALRRVWGSSQSHASSPLATLASAASTFQHPRHAYPQHHPRQWDDEEVSSRKRRRDDEYAHAPTPAPRERERLPSPSRMRIADLVLPIPRSQGNGSVLHQPQPWQAWSPQLPAIDHGYSSYDHKLSSSYDNKPRVHSEARETSPSADRRPLSSSSSHTTSRTWSSPVQTFEIRL